jgi:hypothetical protein
MPWVRIDEDFAQHPKLMQAGPLGMAMQVAGLCYCNRNLTDGRIPRAAARTLLDWELVDGDGVIWTLGRTSGHAGDDIGSDWVIERLLEAGIWEEVPGAYLIHDYHDYQPSRAEVEAEREQKREAGRLGGLARAKQRGKRRAKQPAKHGAEQPPSTVPSDAQAECLAGTQAESKPVPVPVPGLDPGLRDNGVGRVSTVGEPPSDPTAISNTERHRLAHVAQGKADPEHCDLCARAQEAQ